MRTCPRPLQGDDIEIAYVDGSRMVKLTIRQSKTDQLGRKTTLFLSVTGNLACSLSSVSNFRAVFTQAVSNSRQFLVHFDGNSVMRYQFSSILAKTVQFCNITGEFRTHSFRIGAATEAAMRGIPDHTIKQCGRWNLGLIPLT